MNGAKQCEAVLEVPASDGSKWRKGRRCPEDGVAEHSASTRSRRKVWLCWVHGLALTAARRVPLRMYYDLPDRP